MNKWTCASKILTFVGAVGVVATAVITAKATPKAIDNVKEAEREKGEELTKKEIVKAAAPAYIPAIITGVATVSCIFSANATNKRYQKHLLAACGLAERAYSQYADKVKTILREDDYQRIKDIEYDDEYEDEDEVLFFDYTTLKYFNSKLEKVTMEDGMECYIISTPFDPFIPIVN